VSCRVCELAISLWILATECYERRKSCYQSTPCLPSLRTYDDMNSNRLNANKHSGNKGVDGGILLQRLLSILDVHTWGGGVPGAGQYESVHPSPNPSMAQCLLGSLGTERVQTAELSHVMKRAAACHSSSRTVPCMQSAELSHVMKRAAACHSSGRTVPCTESADLSHVMKRGAACHGSGRTVPCMQSADLSHVMKRAAACHSSGRTVPCMQSAELSHGMMRAAACYSRGRTVPCMQSADLSRDEERDV
jgi:hypothetical protein